MKRTILSVGFALSLLLTSCSTDFNDFESDSLEQTQEKASTLINVSQAKNAALNFVNNSKKNKAKGIPNVTEENLEEIQTLVNDEDQPVMYFLNLKENQGFVVMSASTLERPILAYSDSGRFDLETVADVEGVNDWLLTKYLKINGLENNGEYWSDDIPNQWNAVGVQHMITNITPN